MDARSESRLRAWVQVRLRDLLRDAGISRAEAREDPEGAVAAILEEAGIGDHPAAERAVTAAIEQSLRAARTGAVAVEPPRVGARTRQVVSGAVGVRVPVDPARPGRGTLRLLPDGRVRLSRGRSRRVFRAVRMDSRGRLRDERGRFI